VFVNQWLTRRHFHFILSLVDQQPLFEIRPDHPGKILRRMIEERGWTQEDLAAIIGKSRQAVSEIVSGKNGIALDMAVALGAAFGNNPQEWLAFDQVYRLSVAERNVSDVRQMAQLYRTAPVRDMVKRGWIRPELRTNELKAELEAFFESDSLQDGVQFPVATRRTVTLTDLSPAEVAWCFRARHLAKGLLAEQFLPNRIDKAQAALKRLTVHPKEARHVPTVLAEYGIRFLVIEPLPNVKIDGAAFWIDAGPVIALSLRYDRIDGFWFTLMHEFMHIRHGDPLSVDSGLVDATKGVAVTLVEDEAERRANSEASDALVPSVEMDSFVRRVGPLYPRARVIQFANRLRTHPGIIVGQLQHRQELGYMALRDVLVKIREFVTATALTDGWGNAFALSTQ
jgi:HTH-type transcriptional regulator/antitoxin HigA